MRFLRHLLRKPDDAGAGGAEGGAPAPSPAPAPGPAPSPAPEPSPSPAPAPGPAPSPAPGPAPAPSPSPAPAPDDVKATWPENWRETVSKGDAKILKRMERYASPEALADALVAAQNRISSGELKPALKKDATEEQVAEWRAANGVPEKADGYDVLKDPKLTDNGKAFLAEYLPIAHAANMTPDQVKANLTFIGAMNKQEAEQRAARDVELEDAGEEVLRAEWGGEYKKNITFIQNMLDGAASPKLKEELLSGRLADGTPIGSSPDVLRLLMSLALIQNPAGTLVPGHGGNPAKGIDDEIAEIEKTMGTKAYTSDEKKQARYRELVDARETLKRRA